ncbi:uncharacterized protein LOC121776501 [Salvia splendens]|uniref:uncharacterized protein LOC121776501 n=1 Tax=Salvia splendens TaxID=180675 RepID=UPI001C279C36|nr:uncharacterized protein LOC121776501 [Salvia splendens]
MLLRTEPSFCIYTDDEFGQHVGNVEAVREKIESTATIGENADAEFSFGENGMRVIQEVEDEDEQEEGKAPSRFKNLKIETGGDQTIPSIFLVEGGGGDADAAALTKWRNHAEYLESTGDLCGAEEYYFRATEADPEDGELLSQYAKLVWQLRGDQAKALRYFEKAVEAAPANSDVLATYASFLWNVGESEGEEHLADDTQVNENLVMVDSFGGAAYHHHQFGQPHPRPETDPYQWSSLYVAPTTEYGQPQPPPFSDRPDPSYGLPWFGSRDEQPPYTAAKTTAAAIHVRWSGSVPPCTVAAARPCTVAAAMPDPPTTNPLIPAVVVISATSRSTGLAMSPNDQRCRPYGASQHAT